MFVINYFVTRKLNKAYEIISRETCEEDFIVEKEKDSLKFDFDKIKYFQNNLPNIFVHMEIFLQIFILLLVIVQNIFMMNTLKIFFLEKENFAKMKDFIKVEFERNFLWTEIIGRSP